MKTDIKKQSQDLISNFNEAVGNNKSKAMVIVSTSTKKDNTELMLACAGTGPAILNLQAVAIVNSFSHLIKNGTIKHPQIQVVEFLSNLNKELLEVAGGVSHANK